MKRVKASCDFMHYMIMASKEIFVNEEYSLEETPLDQPCVQEIDEVMPCDMELVDPNSIKSPTKPISTAVVLPLFLL